MRNTITIECPPELLLGLHLNAEGFADYLKKQAAIGLFKEGKLSSGTAATWLGIGRMDFLRMAFDAGAKRILLPMSSVTDIPTVPGELFAKFQTSFYSDPVDAVFKALGVE